MNMKVFSCYSSGEGFYDLLNNNLTLVFLNVVYPCSIKDLYKGFKLKKDYNLKVLSVKSFIKLAALRDNNQLLSFFYPRGFVLITSLDAVVGFEKFLKCEEDLRDIGEIVAIKPFSNVVITVDFWKTFLKFGVFLDYSVILNFLCLLLRLVFSFNYIVLNLLGVVLCSVNDNIKSIN